MKKIVIAAALATVAATAASAGGMSAPTMESVIPAPAEVEAMAGSLGGSGSAVIVGGLLLALVALGASSGT